MLATSKKHMYISELNIKEIKEHSNSLSNSKYLSNPVTKILYTSYKAGKVLLLGYFYKAIVRIDDFKSSSNIELKVKYNFSVQIILAMIILLLFSFIYQDNVTINGNSNPTIIERLQFVGIGCAMLAIPVLVIVNMKASFYNRIVKELKLKKPVANN